MNETNQRAKRLTIKVRQLLTVSVLLLSGDPIVAFGSIRNGNILFALRSVQD